MHSPKVRAYSVPVSTTTTRKLIPVVEPVSSSSRWKRRIRLRMWQLPSRATSRNPAAMNPCYPMMHTRDDTLPAPLGRLPVRRLVVCLPVFVRTQRLCREPPQSLLSERNRTKTSQKKVWRVSRSTKKAESLGYYDLEVFRVHCAPCAPNPYCPHDSGHKEEVLHMRLRLTISCIAFGSVLSVAPMVRSATLYTSDSHVADFTSLVSSYATFTDFGAGDVSSPFTPSSSEIAANGFRVFAGTLTGPNNPNFSGQNWMLATFATAQSSILVFPNIDHFGAAFDGYQYSIEGSNDLTTWTPLFNALTVTGSGEPFTLGSFTGTAPLSVNNVLTPGSGPGGTVGYEAQFSFGTGYKYYAFGASTEASNSGNLDIELSAVGAGASATVPEPTSLLLLGMGLLGLGVAAKRKLFS
jgi:PEP-CTERM motif